MYSVVMMLALSGGAEVADFGHRGGGCCGGYSCCGCCGGWRPLFPRLHGWHSWHGCCGCCGGYVGCAGCVGYGGTIVPGPGVMPGAGPGKTFYPGEVSQNNNDTPNVFVNFRPQGELKPATVNVSLPADSRLTFNGWTSANKSATRRFKTPALEPGQEYTYTLRAEIVRDGQTIVQNHQVVVRAGQETRVTIAFPTVVLSQNQN